MILSRTEQEKYAEMMVVLQMDYNDIPKEMSEWTTVELAHALGIVGYTGTEEQYNQLVNLCMGVSDNPQLEDASRTYRVRIIYIALKLLDNFR